MPLARHQVRALRRLLPLERVERQPLFAREPERRWRGLARRRERRRDRRPHDDLVEILLALGDAADTCGQPPRRGETLDRDVGRHAQLAKARFQLLRHLPGQARQPCGRKLFDADLDE